jgi:uncharacterized protein YkwD
MMGKNEGAGTRMIRFGYNWSRCGENIGHNTTPDGMSRSWMRSSIHRRNILDRRSHEVDIGACTGDYIDSRTTLYTVDFGAHLLNRGKTA